jgi:signal transduction histidine kinase
MTAKTDPDLISAKADSAIPLYKGHLRGAFIRSAASLVMWLTSLVAYRLGIIHVENLISNTFAVTYLILMNPPLLWFLKRIRNRRHAQYFSLFINFLEIIGYTAVMHAFGGIEAIFLILIYASLITYVGIVGTRQMPFIIAGLCSISFFMMVALEHGGILHPLRIKPLFYLAWPDQVGILAVNVILLFVLAFISSTTAQLLKRNRDKLQRQNKELQQMIVKARESDRLKSEFLANTSHELRTPLNAIIGFSELLKDQCLGALNEKQRAAARDIHASGNHLLSIINDILDLSKAVAGKVELTLSEIRLKPFLENCLSTFREIALERRIRLSMETEDCPETVQADERKLTQILYNLLSNATKFTPGGGAVTLSARQLHRTPNGWGTQRGAMVLFPVAIADNLMNYDHVVEVFLADTGIGLKEEDLQRIFNPFEQVDGSKSRRYQGTGLGLSLTKQFVELHNGEVWAESNGENRGSILHFVIPG